MTDKLIMTTADRDYFLKYIKTLCTGSMSICRGTYILLNPPSHNNFSKMVLGKAAADAIIDAAIAEGGA